MLRYSTSTGTAPSHCGKPRGGSMRSSWPRKHDLVLLALVGFLIVEPVTSWAQSRPRAPVGRSSGAVRRPTVSPYLNLFNSNRIELDYYNFLRPQQQMRGAANQLYRELSNLESNMQRVQSQTEQKPGEPPVISTGRMAPTGHPATFSNLSGYFPGSTNASGRRR